MIDGTRVDMHAIIDNFSRRILAWCVDLTFDQVGKIHPCHPWLKFFGGLQKKVVLLALSLRKLFLSYHNISAPIRRVELEELHLGQRRRTFAGFQTSFQTLGAAVKLGFEVLPLAGR